MRRGMKILVAGMLAALLASPASCSDGPDPLVIGAVYPTGGAQGMGGLEEFRGLELAAEMANRRGGVRGRPIDMRLAPADAAEAASFAVRTLVAEGVEVIAGSYGSTVSDPAARTASSLGAVFWETGAVGLLGEEVAAGDLVFRFAPTGGSLGTSAVAFVRDELVPRMLPAEELSYGVVYVDDVYGRSVGLGAIEEIRASGLPLSGTFAYRLPGADFEEIARRIAAAGTDVLVVAAYLEDGVALRRAVLRAGVPMAAMIGTSSSYCHLEFGRILGQRAVGVFASDKPDADVVDLRALTPEAAAVLDDARGEYRRRYGEGMSAAALSGFSGGWALFRHVLARADDSSAASVAEAARTVRLPAGALPNGSGLRFGAPGAPGAGDNALAATVIWEWVRPYTREIVWPPAFATSDIVLGTDG